MANNTTDQPAPLEPGEGETNDPVDASETAQMVAPEGEQTEGETEAEQSEGTPVDTGTADA